MANDRAVQVPVIDSGGVFKDWTNSGLHKFKVDTVITDITSKDVDTPDRYPELLSQ